MDIKTNRNTLTIDGRTVTLPLGSFWISSVCIQESWIYLGSVGCCQGHLYQLDLSKLEFFQIISLNANAEDILPAEMNESKQKHVLSVGSGCGGAGLRLVNMFTAHTTEIMGSEEYYSHLRGTVPSFRVNEAAESIYLDLQSTVFPRERETIDLTQRLQAAGVDIKGTLRLNSSATRFRAK